MLFHLVSHLSGIGDDAEHRVSVNYPVPEVVAAVVRHGEACDMECADIERVAVFDVSAVAGFYLLSDAIVLLYAVMHGIGRIYRRFGVGRDDAHRFDVVGMVVCDENGFQHCLVDAIVGEVFPETSYADTGVDHYSSGFIEEVIAVSATAAAETYEL